MLAIEYLAPEFVFNLGHDFAADLWALGITLYEMFLGVTPFAPKRADNITELFNNIAITKVFVIRHKFFCAVTVYFFDNEEERCQPKQST